MAKENLCTESPFELFNYNKEDKYPYICNLANQAVEKFLKGFIKENGQPVTKTHEIDKFCYQALNINLKFSEIKEHCLKVYDFYSGMRYSSETPITKSDVIDVIESTKIIYNFEPIKNLRKKFSKMNNYSQPKDLKIGPLDSFILR